MPPNRWRRHSRPVTKLAWAIVKRKRIKIHAVKREVVVAIWRVEAALVVWDNIGTDDWEKK